MKRTPCRVRFAENPSLNDTSPLYIIDDSDEENKDEDDKNESMDQDKCDIKEEIKNVQSIPENILKVYLENGQTKTFTFKPTDTVKVSRFNCDRLIIKNFNSHFSLDFCSQSVFDKLVDKLAIKRPKHFSLCIEYVKSIKNNKMQVLDMNELVSNIAALPSAHNMVSADFFYLF